MSKPSVNQPYISASICRASSFFLDEAEGIKNTEIAEELALPPVKIHCSVLAEDAIKAAISDYRSKHVEASNEAVAAS